MNQRLTQADIQEIAFVFVNVEPAGWASTVCRLN